MRQRGRNNDLALKPLLATEPRDHRSQHFHHHRPIVLAFPGQKHRRHPAAAQLSHDLVAIRQRIRYRTAEIRHGRPVRVVVKDAGNMFRGAEQQPRFIAQRTIGSALQVDPSVPILRWQVQRRIEHVQRPLRERCIDHNVVSFA